MEAVIINYYFLSLPCVPETTIHPVSLWVFAFWTKKPCISHESTLRQWHHYFGGNLKEQREVRTNFLSSFFASFSVLTCMSYSWISTLLCYLSMLSNILDIYAKVLFMYVELANKSLVSHRTIANFVKIFQQGGMCI